MKKYIVTSFAAAALLMTGSCDTDFENDVLDVVPTAGSADFSRYVAIGNSLTSGYRDNALYLDGQQESFPSMIAQGMKQAGGGDFKQPLMPNNIGGFTGLGIAGKLTLQVVNGALSPVPSAPGGPLDNIVSGGPYNNLGVPGAKSYHLVAEGYGNPAGLAVGKANPYFVRFASEPNTSVLKDAMKQKPTFFSLWIGNNDVLAYATSGGAGIDQKGNPNPATYGSNDISDPQMVAGVIKSMLDGLKSVGATKGVIANIPNVTAIPYFTTVPAMPIAGLTTQQISDLASGYAAYNAGLAQARAGNLISDAEYQSRRIEFKATVANGAVIEDKDLTNLSALGIPSYRQTTAEDLILLPASTVLKTGGGTKTALADALVLTKKETAKVIAATTAYNAAIAQLAGAYGLALVDANKKIVELNAKGGIQYDGVRYTTTFVTGGAFSLDGVHLTGRGYAIIANEFIKAINNTYGSTLPMVNANQYSGVTFP